MVRVFASHDWGKEGANHAAVKAVVQELRARGIDVWFDDTHMKGNVLDAMTAGIDASDIVLVFVTRNYVSKVKSTDTDNVRREFMYAAQQPHKLVAVRFDAELPHRWDGPVGMVLGCQLYTDLSTVTPRAMDALVSTITAKRAVTPRRTSSGMRKRVELVLHEMGDVLATNEHMGVAVDRVVRSLYGTAHENNGLPFCRKLKLVEEQIAG